MLHLSTLLLALTTSSAVLVAGQSSSARASSSSARSATPTATGVPVVPGTSPLPLQSASYVYPNLPYKVNPFAVGRGPQSGFNLCNDSTTGPASECQTAFVNNLADFCLWGGPGSAGNQLVGDIEAATVAYCSNMRTPHGSRVMAPGTLTGVQFMRTPAYIQVTGTLEMSGLNLAASDTGGELDPLGADLLGNPLGGLMYSTGLPRGDNTTIQQVRSWNNFVGGGQFCMKLCDPNLPTPNYCENRYDLLGCAYNAPAAYVKGSFLACEGDVQSVVGTYTQGSQTLTYSQPSVITGTLPWTPVIPRSSNCVTYQSSDLYGPAPTASGAAGSAQVTGSAARTSGGTAAVSGPTSAGAAAATSTRASSALSNVVSFSGVIAAMLVGGALVF